MCQISQIAKTPKNTQKKEFCVCKPNIYVQPNKGFPKLEKNAVPKLKQSIHK